MLECQYWKVIIRYGHVGLRNEISVARHLVFEMGANISDIISFVEEMPGTKKTPVVSIKKISPEEYLIGTRNEKENFYLKNLYERSKAI